MHHGFSPPCLAQIGYAYMKNMRNGIISGAIVLSAAHLHGQVAPYVADGFPQETHGWYFTIPFRPAPSAVPARMMILDGAGHIAYHRPAPAATDFRVWPDGRMSYAAGNMHRLMDSTFTVIDSVSCVGGTLTDRHDLRLLPNGHYLLLGTEFITMDLSGYGLFLGNNSPGSATATVECGVIQELDSAQNLLWEWHLADHFDFLETDTTRLNDPEEVDWSHCNAVEMDVDGNILLSSRHFNEITKIDRQADTIIWRLGGANNDFTFVDDPGFYWQHDIRRLPDGHITLFDNSRPGAHPGRGVEYALDEALFTATPVWSRSFDTTAYSVAMGNMQRHADGNTLINWGFLSPDNAVFTVYGPDSSRVRELRFLDTLSSYRSYYFDTLPFTLHRPAITCAPVDGGYQLTAADGWSVYQWSNGDTGQVTMAGMLDTVHVEVRFGQANGWVRSEPFIVAEHCMSTAIGLHHAPTDVLYPDPAGSEVNIRFGGAPATRQVELMDALGRILWQGTTTQSLIRLPLQGLPAGSYLVRVDGTIHRFLKDPAF